MFSYGFCVSPLLDSLLQVIVANADSHICDIQIWNQSILLQEVIKKNSLLLVVELDSVLSFTKKEYFSVEYAALFCLMLTDLPQL